MFDLPPIDVLVAADVLFDEKDFDALFATIDFFFQCQPHLTCIIAYHCRTGPGRIEPYLRQWRLVQDEITFESPALERDGRPGVEELRLLRISKKA